MPERPVLVAPAAFGGTLRATQVASAIARGLEAAGLRPPDLCPVSGGGAGTIEVLLQLLGGETGPGFALIEDGATALVEAADRPALTAERLAAAAAAGPGVIVLAAADVPAGHVERALSAASGLRRTRLVVLTSSDGPRFVLRTLGVEPRLRAARAVVVGEGRLDERAFEGGVAGEIAVRARQAGVPCHAVVGANALDPFGARMLDLQRIVEAPTLAACEAAAAALAEVL